MGRYCFGKIISFFLGICIIFSSFIAQANCPLADKYRQQGKETFVPSALYVCAVNFNDDDSQLKAAEASLKGTDGFKKDELFAVYMYQLAAENGNAEAQVSLAELLQSFDTSPERRKMLKDYQSKLEKTTDNPDDFSGEIQHPYTLLLLASERPENKWYYPSLNRAIPERAMSLLTSYSITPEKRQAALKDASRWKTRKMLAMAKEILSQEEYANFEKRLKNKTTRSQATSELKERMNAYIEKKRQKKGASK